MLSSLFKRLKSKPTVNDWPPSNESESPSLFFENKFVIFNCLSKVEIFGELNGLNLNDAFGEKLPVYFW